jgi:hypothetical protein
MTRAQSAAYVIAMAACAMAELASMMAENVQAQSKGLPPPHSGADFTALIDQHGIQHSAVLDLFQQAEGD